MTYSFRVMTEKCARHQQKAKESIAAWLNAIRDNVPKREQSLKTRQENNMAFAVQCIKDIANKILCNVSDVILIETEQIKGEAKPYYYLFIVKGKRYKLLFDKVVVDKD